MSNTRNHLTLLSAIAGGTVLRAGGGFPSGGRSDMATHLPTLTVLLPIYRGHTR
jgi:hypothetical protein